MLDSARAPSKFGAAPLPQPPIGRTRASTLAHATWHADQFQNILPLRSLDNARRAFPYGVISVSSAFENVRETEEKKELLKRKRELGKRWFTKPERLDRQNEKRGKAAARSEVLAPQEHTGVSSEVRSDCRLELASGIFLRRWLPF